MRLLVMLAALGIVAGCSVDARADADDASTRITRIVEVVRAGGAGPAVGAVVEAWIRGVRTAARSVDASGAARFEDLPRSGVVFVARLAGHRCGWHEPGRWWWHQPDEDGDPDGDGVTRMRLVVTPGSVVEGRVLTRDGAPIAGVVVRAWEEAHATDLWTLEGAPLWSATTDGEGRFRTEAHWPRAEEDDEGLVSAVVKATGAGWIHERTELWPKDVGVARPLTFALRPAGVIQGVVRGADGQPAAGADVHAYPPDFWAFAPEGGSDRDTVRTHPREMHVRSDAAGAYTFAEAHPGTAYRLFAEIETDDVVVARSTVSTGDVEAAGDTTTVNLSARRLGRLRVVLAAEAGGSSSRRRVELTPPPDARPWVYEQDEDGVVTVAEADAGRWTLDVDAGGWRPVRKVVPLAEGESKTVTIRLERGVAVEGRVVDDAGQPVPGATVYAYSVDPENPSLYLDGYEETRSDVEGRFRIDGLRPGPTDLMFRHERLRSDAVVRVEAPAAGVEPRLHAPATLRLVLVPAPGTPCPEHARITLTRLDGARAGTQRQEYVALRGGACRIENVMPGRITCAVEAPGHAPYVTRLRIRPGTANEPDPFALSLGLTLRGRIVDAEERGVEGARVLAWGNPDTAARTDARGDFEIQHLAPGRVELAIQAPGMALTLLTHEIGKATPSSTITVRPGGLVRGSLRYAYGGDPPISIDFFPADATDDNVSRWRADVVDGAFSIRLPAGRYRCAGRHATSPGGPAVFEVEEGGEVVLELVTP